MEDLLIQTALKWVFVLEFINELLKAYAVEGLFLLFISVGILTYKIFSSLY